MKRSRVSDRYARAIFDLANDEKQIDEVVEDFRTLGAAIEGSRDLQNLLETPVVEHLTKDRVLTEIFAGKISELTSRFLSLLVRKGRSVDLPGIVDAFQYLLDQQQNVVTATITTAIELPEEQRVRIEAQLARMSGQSIRADYRVDPSLIGGFRARFEDKMIDASVRHQLDRLQVALAEGVSN